jgi:fermentation-respiration switch protein FrsA (DUF1100 family)
VIKTSRAHAIVRREISFSTPSGPVHGEIVTPQRGKNHAGVLFVHWLGDRKTTNLTEFQSDAVQLAGEGVTSLLVDAMWAKPHWFTQGRSTQTDYRNSTDQVIALRRALDVLLAQPGVDANRIAYVGHDFGAMYGALLSGIDPRPRWFVFMAGTITFSEWYLLGKKPADIPAYVAQMAPIDPMPYLSQLKARGFLFQFAAKDPYITTEHEMRFFSAAPLPRAMYVYDAGHSLTVPQASRDRLNWLLERLAPPQG